MKILFVCTQGKNRSRTASGVWKKLHPEDEVLSIGSEYFDEKHQPQIMEILDWADRIYAMEERHKKEIISISRGYERIYVKIKVLGIPDLYDYNNPELVRILKTKLK